MDPGEAKAGERARRRRRLVLLLVFLSIIGLLIFAFRAILGPFLIAVFLAYLIDPVVKRLAPVRIYGRLHLGRGGAVVALYLVLIGMLYLGGLFAIPALGRQVSQLHRDLPAVRDFVEEKAQLIEAKLAQLQGRAIEPPAHTGAATPESAGAATPESTGAATPESTGPARYRFELRGGGALEGVLVDRTEEELVLRLGRRYEILPKGRIRAQRRLDAATPPSTLRQIVDRYSRQFTEHLDSMLRFAITFVRALIDTLSGLILVLMITAFIVIDRPAIVGFFQSLPPAHRQPLVKRLTIYFDRGLAGVIRGQLTICGVNGALTFVGLHLLDVRYSLLLGLVAGTFSLIPIFGTILSSAPIVLIAFFASGGIQQPLLALGWILVIHFLEANFFNPKIMGAASNIHPVIIIFALIAGLHAYGFAGALLAVPAASLLQSAFKFFVIDRQADAFAEPVE